MCQIFVNTDPILYEARSRSVRIHGMATSIRLENLFWNVLAELAAEQGVTTNRLIVILHDEVVEVHGSVQNLASFLRVSCVRYLTMASTGSASSGSASSGSAPARSGSRRAAGAAGSLMADGASVVPLRKDRSPPDDAS